MNYHMLTEPYRSILNSLSEGVCAVNAQLSIGCFNLQAERLTGITAEHALGSNLKRVFPHDTKAWQKLVMDVLESMKPIRNIRKDLEKPSGERIPVTVNAAPVRDQKGAVTGVVLTFQDNSAIEILRRELRQECTYGDIVTRNSHMHQMLDILPHVAESDSTVLILGSTGTGKELFARAIHAASARSRGPFVAVNCGALPDNLLESELFGYKKGAFTDAKQDKPGRFALAEKGTLFLDEIGDLSPAMQVKLMRVLQEKEYEPLGAIKSETTDVRILAATNRDLIVMVKEGTFRPDLYYRLNVIEFVLPALVDRPEDIPLLVEHFVEVLNAEKGRDIARVSQTAMSWLMDYEYPGNIRELRNIIERAYVLCRYDEIREECLPSHLLENNPVRRSISTRHLSPSLQRMNAEEQENLIREVLIKHNMHRGRTAE
ncbi:MAG: sigma 54-interacting transcriptional regulator, partial [Candidatus Hydrogenedentes bacterium]|nr:sigma 54-interacting transcriptional regulator [Candidatus Hydrogenedentota bacterium]